MRPVGAGRCRFRSAPPFRKQTHEIRTSRSIVSTRTVGAGCDEAVAELAPQRRREVDLDAVPSPSASQPLCVVIAGPNGAGKTTFARNYLPSMLRIREFVNADLIAAGLAPLNPGSAQVRAGRLMLEAIANLREERSSFAFESTLGGRGHLKLLREIVDDGYHVVILYLRLRDVDLAVRRVADRVRQGGHDVPEDAIRRRYAVGWKNFVTLYRPVAHSWAVLENSSSPPRLLETS